MQSRNSLSLLFGALLGVPAVGLLAQSPLTTTWNGTNNTTLSGTTYFDVQVLNPAGITITSLELNSGSAIGQNGFVAFYTVDTTYVGNTDDVGNWQQHAIVPVTSAGPGNPSRALLGGGVYLPAGSHGVAIAGSGITQRFTVGSGCSSTTVPGSCGNSLFQNTDLRLAAGATSSLPFTLPTGSPRVWNGAVHYLVGNTTVPPASARTFGLGTYASGYQFFADAVQASAALEGNSMQFTPSNGSYRLSYGGGTFLGLPLTASPVFPQPIDDGSAFVTLPSPLPTPEGPQSQLEVHSNGIIAWGSTSPLAFGSTPSYVADPGVFLDRNKSAVYSWTDYRESEPGSGRIMQSTTFVGFDQVFCVTWNDVEHHSASTLQNRSTLQFQFNLTTGAITIVWVQIDTDTSVIWGTAHLVGFSPAGPSGNGGSLQLDRDLPLTLATADSGVRCSSNLPRLGTTWVVQSDDHAAGSPIGLVMFGTQVFPGGGIDLGAIGAPGSRAYQNGDLGAFVFGAPVGSGSYATLIPFQASLFGATLHVQTLGFTNHNALALAPSNGLSAQIGY